MAWWTGWSPGSAPTSCDLVSWPLTFVLRRIRSLPLHGGGEEAAPPSR